MTIEEEVFRKTKVNFDKLIKYGFKLENDLYTYSKNIMDNTFRVDINIDKKGEVKGYIFDLSFNFEYTSFRIGNNIGTFKNKVKEEFIKILENIKNKCFIKNDFIYEQTNRIVKIIKEKYGDDYEFEWEKFPGYATFKNQDSKKWYAVIMNINKFKLDNKTNKEVEIINLKLNPQKIDDLLKQNGYFKGYHMNKKNWITIILDDTVPDYQILSLIDESYNYTIVTKSVKNEWIIPANPKYFDIETSIQNSNTITWKQSSNIKINDIVYLYVAKPISAIMYKFKVIDINIPYKYQDKNLKIQKTMKIDLIKRYEPGILSLDKIKEFGIKTVRGPRYMPLSLSKYIKDKIED